MKQTQGLLDGLVQLSFAVQSALGRVAEAHDLSMAQVRLLGILRDREPAMLELAAILELDKSSVTGLVTRAEKRGLVKRHASTEDRRAVHVSITARGRDLVERVVAQGERELAVLVKDLTEVERKRLATLAGQVVAHASRVSK